MLINEEHPRSSSTNEMRDYSHLTRSPKRMWKFEKVLSSKCITASLPRSLTPTQKQVSIFKKEKMQRKVESGVSTPAWVDVASDDNNSAWGWCDSQLCLGRASAAPFIWEIEVQALNYGPSQWCLQNSQRWGDMQALLKAAVMSEHVRLHVQPISLKVKWKSAASCREKKRDVMTLWCLMVPVSSICHTSLHHRLTTCSEEKKNYLHWILCH